MGTVSNNWNTNNSDKKSFDSVRIDSNLDSLQKAFDDLVLSTKGGERRRLFIDLANKSIRISRGRLRQSVDVYGHPFKPTNQGKKPLKKILKKRTQRGQTYAYDIGEETIGIRSTVPFAGEHQYGAIISKRDLIAAVSLSEFRRFYHPCEPRQAILLKNNWKRIWKHPAVLRQFRDKNYRKNHPEQQYPKKTKTRVTIRWIRDNYSIGSAGALIRLAGLRKSRGTKSDKVVIPKRKFFGIIQRKEVEELSNYVVDRYESLIRKAFKTDRQ